LGCRGGDGYDAEGKGNQEFPTASLAKDDRILNWKRNSIKGGGLAGRLLWGVLGGKGVWGQGVENNGGISKKKKGKKK